MSATRGGTGRGRGGSGRGGGVAGVQRPGNASALPLSVQMRQMEKLNEPPEVAIIRRMSPIGAITVSSVYGATGLLERTVQVAVSSVNPAWGLTIPEGATTVSLSMLAAEGYLRQAQDLEVRERVLRRRAARLPEGRRETAYEQLSGEEVRLLTLSNKDWEKTPEFAALRRAGAEQSAQQPTAGAPLGVGGGARSAPPAPPA